MAEPKHQLVGDRGDCDAVGGANELAEALQRHRSDCLAHGPAQPVQPTIVDDRNVVREPALTGVNGTTMACRIGKALNRSMDTTTQGRVSRCSLATVGSRFTDQT